MSRRRKAAAAPQVVPLAEARGMAGPCIATVPGELAPVYPVELPDKLRHATRDRIARRQIAERLGLPEDALDIRPLGGGADWSHVVVSDAAQSQDWRGTGAGAGCTAILPDYLALPVLPDGWSLRASPGRITARLGPADGFAAAPDLAAAQLRRAAEDAAPRGVLVDGELPEALSALFAGLDLPVYRDAADLQAAGLDVPRPPDPQALPVNLALAVDAAEQQLRARLKRWSVPALLAGLAFALWCGGTLLQIEREQARIAATRQATEGLLRASFIPSGPILDIRAQVSRRLAQIGPAASDSAPGPMQILRRAAGHLDGSGIALQAVSYRGASGLEATVTSPDFARLDAFAASLRADGLPVTVLDSRAGEDGEVRARLALGGTA